MRIVFNTRRGYTEHGQRIAAQRLRDGIAVVDVDRNVSFFIHGGSPHHLQEDEVMAAYDFGFYVPWPSGSEESYALRDELREAANAI